MGRVGGCEGETLTSLQKSPGQRERDRTQERRPFNAGFGTLASEHGRLGCGSDVCGTLGSKRDSQTFFFFLFFESGFTPSRDFRVSNQHTVKGCRPAIMLCHRLAAAGRKWEGAARGAGRIAEVTGVGAAS